MGVDMIANAIAPGIGGMVSRAGTGRVIAGATTLALDAGAGAGGEYLSQKAIGEEADSKSLWLEAAGELGGSGPVNVYQAIRNPRSYKINGKKASSKNIKDLLEAELDYKTGTIKVKDIGKVKLEGKFVPLDGNECPVDEHVELLYKGGIGLQTFVSDYRILDEDGAVIKDSIVTEKLEEV